MTRLIRKAALVSGMAILALVSTNRADAAASGDPELCQVICSTSSTCPEVTNAYCEGECGEGSWSFCVEGTYFCESPYRSEVWCIGGDPH
jgi:hypothetical protein